ncbi:hypothetical protein [Microbacterium sp. SS28]|uniref:hypothetical protein n=1 Tax=Microbacterium sp. SS28 TaxID=2919948 RepID=UPI001FAAC3B9|nr:hypothetical protein [Microbacterium sp. SS28]
MIRAMGPRRPLEWYRDPDGRAVDARLHLLDRQILDREATPISTVDDIELAGVEVGERVDHSQQCTVSAMLVGVAVLPRVFGGRLPRSSWERLPWALVSRLGIVITIDALADDLDATWVERFVRDRIVGRIPGGRHDPE